MTRAAIYTRVSTEEQAEKYGLDAQLEKCEAMATVKGWEIAQVFKDQGISGTIDESGRPGLLGLVEAIDQGEIDAVIVYALDRLGRSTALVLKIVERFENGGVDLISCVESFDTSTATGKFVLRMFASLAELERDTITERTTAGRNARGRIDGEKGGRVPMGYRRTENGIEINPAGAALVKFIFNRRGEGATLAVIADELNDEGQKTPRGGIWHASSVREILLNEDKYRGGFRGESEVSWPVILEG